MSDLFKVYFFLQFFMYITCGMVVGKLFFDAPPIYYLAICASGTLTCVAYILKAVLQARGEVRDGFIPFGILIWAAIVIMNVIELTVMTQG